jgi:hypothetical protein
MSLFQNQNGIWRKSHVTLDFVRIVAFENQNRIGSAAFHAARCTTGRWESREPIALDGGKAKVRVLGVSAGAKK